METLLRAELSNAVAATLMATLVIVLSRPLARRPAILHGLWLLVLIKLVTPPFYEVPIPWPIAAAAAVRVPIEASFAEVDVRTVGVNDDDRREPAGAVPCPVDRCEERPGWSGRVGLRADSGPTISVAMSMDAGRWIGMTWLAGSWIVLLLSLRRIRRFQRLLEDARCGSWLEQDWVNEWAGRLGLRRAPDLWWVPGPISPMIWFVGARPRLVIPQELWKRLDARQRSTLIAHELAHLRRGDHLVRLLELAVTALFWWHPLVWWMRGPLRDVEEQCCDAWVVWALPDAVRAYAETLLDTLEFLQKSGRPDPLLASGLGKAPHLRRRLTMIMTGTPRRSPGLPGKLGLLLVAGVMLPVGASWARKPDEPSDETNLVEQFAGVVELRGDVVQATPGRVAVVARLRPEKDPAARSVVEIHVVDRDHPGYEVELSGSAEDVVKKLEKHIVELKARGDSSEPAKERVQSLAKAVEVIRQVASSSKTITIDADGLKREVPQDYRVEYRARLGRADAGGGKAEEVAKTRDEVAKLKRELKETVDRLARAQKKLRELGEDPGDTPLLGWHRSGDGPNVETRYTVIRTPTYTTVRPVKPAVPPSDRQRLEQLEKKLKALQQEFDGLKKGSGDRAGKK